LEYEPWNQVEVPSIREGWAVMELKAQGEFQLVVGVVSDSAALDAATDHGFDFTLLHDVLCRVLTHEAGLRFRESLPSRLQSKGLGKGTWHATG
jgi:hypothetical protein